MGDKARHLGETGFFTSAPLVALLIRHLRAVDPGLLPSELREPDALAAATWDANEKRRLLEHAYAQGGALPLLEVGSFDDKALFLPALEVLIRSRSTAVLADKWMRLERYHHATHRTRIGNAGKSAWTCTRYVQSGDKATPVENLFICGLMAGLLRRYGCRNIIIEMKGLRHVLGAGAGRNRSPSGAADRWRIQWTLSQETYANDEAPSTERPAPEPIMGRVDRLLRQDLGEVWRLEDAARHVGCSARSLQREIKAAGHTFSSLVRGARSQEACRLLIDGDMSLSDIGYWCGYADQAHFQRDFKRAINMTPKDYRQFAQD